MTRRTCHEFRPNEVRLWLSMIAYNLGNLRRRLVLSLRVGTGPDLLLAERHLTLRLFGAMVRRIAVLAVPTG
jgi:hypothetical protein